jgi:hypothetical protein
VTAAGLPGEQTETTTWLLKAIGMLEEKLRHGEKKVGMDRELAEIMERNRQARIEDATG